MSQEVFIRRKQLRGNLSELVRCQVLSDDGETMKVMMQGHRVPLEIKKANTIPANKIGGLHARASIVPKQHPASPFALNNILPK